MNQIIMLFVGAFGLAFLAFVLEARSHSRTKDHIKDIMALNEFTFKLSIDTLKEQQEIVKKQRATIEALNEKILALTSEDYKIKKV